MLDIKFIRQNPEKVKIACQHRGVKVNIERLLKLDEERRSFIQKIESLRAEKNKGQKSKIEELRAKKEEIKKLESALEIVEKEYKELMYQIPNFPLDDVPVGSDEKHNEVVREVGKKPQGKFFDYLEIAQDSIDIERAAKTSGSRFYYLKDKVALLELKLINFAVDFLSNEKNIKKVIEKKQLAISYKPFVPVVPPLMLKSDMMKGMGYLDQAPDETYFIEKDDLYLIGTAEQSLIAMHANEILKEKDLPIRYVGFPCSSFRREAGSYGKDVRGIFRVHQFEKVEMVSFTTPEASTAEQELMLGLEEELLSTLKIPYRISKLCTGETSWPSAKTYDIECYMIGQGRYRETHSCSNCTDFQARRLNIRYRQTTNNKQQTTKFVHTLNATGLAMPRIMIALIENYQDKKGGFNWPKILE